MAALRTLLMAALNFREGEGWPLLLLTVHWFLNGICIVLFYTAASALFLREFDTDALPYVYIASAAVSMLVGFLYSHFESRLDRTVLLKVILCFVVLSVLVLWVAFALTGSTWIAASMMVWRDVIWILLSIEVWAIAGLVFNVRQAKRLFGVIGAGEVAADILGGLSVSFLLRFMAVRTLLRLGGPEKASCRAVRKIASAHLDDIRAKIADLRKLERLLAKTVAQCTGTTAPVCPVLDILDIQPAK